MEVGKAAEEWRWLMSGDTGGGGATVGTHLAVRGASCELWLPRIGGTCKTVVL